MNKGKKISRRAMIGGSASIALTAPLSVGAGSSAAAGVVGDATSEPLPTRKLGKHGPEVSMLAMGGQAEALSAEYYNRAFDMGIRYFDVARTYRGGKSEKALADWIAKYPERRKEVFIVTKDNPKHPSDLPRLLQNRLENLGTDYLDCFLIHGLGAREYGEGSYDWVQSDEYGEICRAMKASGKTRLTGFSCHDLQSDRYLHAAAEGGHVDMILMHSSPFHQAGDGMDRAIEACHQSGIGLVGMKVMRNSAHVPKRIPEFDDIGLTTHQAALHALWSDERFSGAVIWMANEEQMKENAEAARKYEKPLLAEHRERLHELVLASGPAVCPGCATCRSIEEQHQIDLKSISRYVAYYEQDGSREAIDACRAMVPSQKDLSRIDLADVQKRCDYHVNYPEILKRAEYYFG